MHGSCIGTDYDYATDVIAVSKACIAGLQYRPVHITATGILLCRRRGRREKGRAEKEGEGKVRRVCNFVDGSHEWGQEGNGDCGRVVIRGKQCIKIKPARPRGSLYMIISDINSLQL